MPRALKKCNGLPGKHCVNDTAGRRCDDCAREADRARGTAAERGYSGPEHAEFRRRVLAKHRWCQIKGCRSRSTDADHYPQDRKELVRLGLDANDPDFGRGLCGYHHKSETAKLQSGWTRR